MCAQKAQTLSANISSPAPTPLAVLSSAPAAAPPPLAAVTPPPVAQKTAVRVRMSWRIQCSFSAILNEHAVEH